MARPSLRFSAPLVIAIGAALLLLAAAIETGAALHVWLVEGRELPRELMLHVLVGGAAFLLAASVLITRRSARAAEDAEAALRRSEERLRLIADNVPALISYIDRDLRFRYSNRTYDAWFGIAQERMLGRTVAEVFGERYDAMRTHVERVLAGEGVEFEVVTDDSGRGRTLQVSCVPQRGPGGAVSGFYMLANDVSALKRAQEDLRRAALQLERDARRLEFLAHHDTLTGLPNRAMFEERAREAVAHARRHDKTAAFLFLDLDNFKPINDSLGHEVGDALLKVIASRLRASVRGDDFVARIGGDEFCVLMQDVADAREAAAVAQKLIHEIGKSYRVGPHTLGTGASIGIACVPHDGEDVPTLLRLADTAMYRAKERGRNGYQFASVSLNEDAQVAAERAEELRAGLGRGELFVVYQPRIDVATRQVVGAEALLRWRHPRWGVLHPNAFLPLADELGLLVPAGAIVLEEACRQGRRWLDAGIRPFTVVVNVSARQLREGALPEQISRALQSSGLPAHALLIEVPEAVLRELNEPLEEALAAIIARGARLGVDDFGTGHASIPMLQRLRASAVCIDRKLVSGVPEDAERADLARALIRVAQGLGVDVIAKGVESLAQRDALAEAGCRIFQGDLFAAPGHADEVEPILRARRAA